MDDERSKTGALYVVATPIGNLADMTHRAIATLQSVQLIAAEDTRQTGKLCAHYAIDTPMSAYHEHNEVQRTPVLLEHLLQGEDLALVTDAGSPLVSDPGFRLVSAARDAGATVVPVPGPCAAIAALTAAGLACHHFYFEGFLPARSGARRNRLQALKGATDTLIFYESSHRVVDTLRDMCEVFGAERPAVLARELTKLHETIRGDSVQGLLDWVDTDPDQRKGEHVVLVAGAENGGSEEGERVLEILCRDLPVSQAADLAARITGVPRNHLYKRALDLRDGDS